MRFWRFLFLSLVLTLAQPLVAIAGRAYLPFEVALVIWLAWAGVSIVFLILAGLYIREDRE